MNITSIKTNGFANGFDNFCFNCGKFFSVQFEETDIGNTDFCPYCGEDLLAFTIDGIIHHCTAHGTDPVNFYSAFPLDEPIPQSETGATPRQVKTIISLVVLDKQAKRPVTVDRIAVKSDTPREIVEKIFDELHITETGGTECTE